MSNVLIGIIGVILFIGLALAGALFLGPRFQEATTSSKAAVLVQQMQQVSAAINLYQLEGGQVMDPSKYDTNMQTLVTQRYLKVAPVNAFKADEPFYTAGPTGSVFAPYTDHVYTELGTSDQARSICKSIEVNFGASDGEAAMEPRNWPATVAAKRRVGCFRTSTTSPYYVYGSV